MWTRTDDWRCQEHVRHIRSPNSAYAQRHLLERVAAEAEAERRQWDHLVRRDVAEVDRRSELLDEPRLRGLRRRLEDDVHRTDRHRDLADQVGTHAAGGIEDAGGAAFPRPRDH